MTAQAQYSNYQVSIGRMIEEWREVILSHFERVGAKNPPQKIRFERYQIMTANGFAASHRTIENVGGIWG